MSYLCPLCHTTYDEPLGQCPDDGTDLIANLIGQSIGGRYTIKDLLGLGGSGATVWSAWQEDVGRKVAVKLIPLDEAERDDFLDASGKAALLDHENVVRVYDFNKTEDGLACGVMELVEGRPLSVELSEGRAMPVDESLDLIRQVLAGLEHAHDNGVLHLDLKPSNMFVVPTDDGQGPPLVKLVDFGLVKPRPVTARFAGPLVSEERIPEALHYTAPELLANGRAGPQSDLYSVGALLYRLLSGKTPFPFEKATEVARGHLTHLPPSPFSIRPIGEMPAALPEILEQALDKAPARRFESANAMLRAIDAALRGETLIDAREEATVARVRVGDLLLPPPGLTKSPPPSVEPDPPELRQPVAEADGSRRPLIVAAVVMSIALAVLAWQQFGGRPAPAPATPPAPEQPIPPKGVTPTPEKAQPRPTAPKPAAPKPATPPAQPATPPGVKKAGDPSAVGTPDPAGVAPVDPGAAAGAPAAPADTPAAPADTPAAPADTPAAPTDTPAESKVTLTSNPPGAYVWMDNKAMGTTPWSTALAPGRYLVRLRKNGYMRRTVRFEVPKGGDPVAVTTALVKLPEGETDAPTPAPAPAEPVKPKRKITVLGDPGGPKPPPPVPAPSAIKTIETPPDEDSPDEDTPPKE